jgi:hypothetical protein
MSSCLRLIGTFGTEKLMSKESEQKRESDRQARLADALRANLRRRKIGQGSTATRIPPAKAPGNDDTD